MPFGFRGAPATFHRDADPFPQQTIWDPDCWPWWHYCLWPRYQNPQPACWDVLQKLWEWGLKKKATCQLTAWQLTLARQKLQTAVNHRCPKRIWDHSWVCLNYCRLFSTLYNERDPYTSWWPSRTNVPSMVKKKEGGWSQECQEASGALKEASMLCTQSS